MYKSGQFVRKFITADDFDEELQVQPNGVDLRIGKIELINVGGTIRIVKEKSLKPEYTKMTPQKNGLMYLTQGSYVVTYKERVEIPKGHVGYVFPRSTLTRYGAYLTTALWDTGYKGIGTGCLIVLRPISLEMGVRIAQICFIEAEHSGKYKGQYQHEGLGEHILLHEFGEKKK